MKLLSVMVISIVSAVNMAAETAQERLKTANEVFTEIMATPDKAIPADLIAKAQCVVIVPGMKKAAFLVGGEYGKGFVTCRHANGKGWGAPAGIRIEGGSVGFQIGGESIDVVMLVMNRRGMDQLMRNKFTLGGDASVAAGPVGRTAAAKTDVSMTAEILAWSRSKGLFGGVALNGATLRGDDDVNKELYGQKLDTHQVVMTNRKSPAAASALIATLDRYSMRKVGSADRKR